MTWVKWGGVAVVLGALACSKPRATLEVERQVTIVSPPPTGLTLPPQGPGVVVGTPVGNVNAAPPSTVPPAQPAPSRPSGWVRGEKR